MKRRNQKFASAEAARRSRELDASWAALMKKYPAKNVSGIIERPLDPIPKTLRVQQSEVHSVNAGVDPLPIKKAAQRYEGDMLKREIAAKAEYESMKTRIAPAYNKGGLQFLSESEVSALRRGELRRR